MWGHNPLEAPILADGSLGDFRPVAGLNGTCAPTTRTSTPVLHDFCLTTFITAICDARGFFTAKDGTEDTYCISIFRMTRPHIAEQSASHLIPAQSHALDVPNVRNFRDAGISPIRSGILYRSGSLNRLTEAGANRLRELGIRTVIDLRSGAENAVWPGRKHGVKVEWISLPALPDRAGLQEMGLKDFSGFDGKAWPIDPAQLYPFMAVYAGPAIGRLVKELIRPGVLPVVVQCAVGKDRTGLAMAVIQSLLGAAQTDVVADFVQSNVELALTAGPTSFTDEAGVTRHSHPVSEALLRSAMETIEAAHGGLTSYLETHGVTSEELAILRSALLP